VREYSNAVEMFVFNAEGMPLDNEYTYGTLAHEFQHMITGRSTGNEALPGSMRAFPSWRLLSMVTRPRLRLGLHRRSDIFATMIGPALSDDPE